MNIIDKNGRLFGKINVIDLSVILILLFAVPMFIFGYRAMTARDDVGKIWVTVKVKLPRVIPELIDVIKSEDIEKDDLGKKIGCLVSVDNIVPSATLVLANDSTHFTLINDPVTKDTTVTLRLLCREHMGYLNYKNLSVKIGSVIIFSTVKYDITGTIIKVSRS